MGWRPLKTAASGHYRLFSYRSDVLLDFIAESFSNAIPSFAQYISHQSVHLDLGVGCMGSAWKKAGATAQRGGT
jgi:hypothetical protein